MEIYLIRHGQTMGNREHRYVGRTDEPLLQDVRENIMPWREPAVDALYVSPMLRCRETASLLFPGMRQLVIEELRECDFGRFEYKNYRELNGNQDYQRFIDSNGACGFPEGETREAFQDRCVAGFYRVLKTEQVWVEETEQKTGERETGEQETERKQKTGEQETETKQETGEQETERKQKTGERETERKQGRERRIAMVVHGGTIMAILDRFSCPHGDYYDWQIENGRGYAADVAYGGLGEELVLENIRELDETGQVLQNGNRTRWEK